MDVCRRSFSFLPWPEVEKALNEGKATLILGTPSSFFFFFFFFWWLSSEHWEAIVIFILFVGLGRWLVVVFFFFFFFLLIDFLEDGAVEDVSQAVHVIERLQGQGRS